MSQADALFDEHRNLLRDLFLVPEPNLDKPIPQLSRSSEEFQYIDEMLALGWISCEGKTEALLEGRCYWEVRLTEIGKRELTEEQE